MTSSASAFKNPGNTTLNWKTSYNAVAEDTLSRDRTKSERPLWSLPREAYSSKRSYHQTEYAHSLGTYGENPRNKLNNTNSKLSNEVHELTMGTTKVTNHIPGYNGFIARTDLNQTAVEHGSGNNLRNTIVK